MKNNYREVYRVQTLMTLTGYNARELAEAVGCDRRTVERWKADGMSENQADVAAVRCGYHPYIIWPEMLTAHIERYVIEETERQAVSA